MHVILRTRRPLPRQRPNLLVYEGRRFKFSGWKDEIMIFTSSRQADAAAKDVVAIQTKRHSDLRFVKRITHGINRLDQIDAYRVAK